MISFRNDYSEGAHPKILDALLKTNLIPTPGYGCDPFCRSAADAIRTRFACESADVHFFVGGTIANLTVIATCLRPWESVIAASTGHINVHETGAIEASGHKVCAIETPDGKLTPDHIRQVILAHRDGNEEHMVLPRMVYISNATELGTIYTKAELQSLRSVCDEFDLFLYLDGARMAAALVADGNDLLPEDFAQLCDCFYIGGTKDGLLFGEAVVITNDQLKPYFRNVMKQRGGMLAKGRLLGVQFGAFLEEDLWLDLARHANRCAKILHDALLEKGHVLYANSCTNQLFPIFDDEMVCALRERFDFDFITKTDATHSVIRFVTSWATREEDLKTLIEAL